MPAATPATLNFIADLRSEREVPADWSAKIERMLSEGMEQADASKIIDALKTLPRNAAVKLPAAKDAEVPAGRYAVERDQGLRFYRVDRPTDGRWAGYTFVSVQASDELHRIRDGRERRLILEEIAKDPAAASRRYGQELGHCGICGRTLTNEVSRAIGIGPVCAGRSGWASAEELDRLKSAGE